MDSTDVLHPPRVASDQLRMESFRTLTWLRLVFEFRPWLEHIQDHFRRDYDNPIRLLWNCFVLGAPLCTLLDLLGLPTPKPLAAAPETFDFDLSLDQRKQYILYFIDKIRILEIQRQLPYGEVLRIEDFFQGTTVGFSRVLQTVRRVINTLYEVYPDFQTEKDHVSTLLEVVDAASQLLAQTDATHPILEAFTLSCTRICQFHGQVTSGLENITIGGDCESWDDIFLFQNKPLRINVMGCYRSICASYLSFKDYLEQQLTKSTVSQYATTILINLSDILSRISSYHVLLQAILDLTPIESSTHDELCSATAYMNDISNTIEEVGKEIRTMRISQLFKSRISIKGVPDYENFGAVQLDDILFGDSTFFQKYHMIVFEKAILCCRSTKSTNQLPFQTSIKAWELGPAVSSLTSPLEVLQVIRKHNFKELHCIDGSFFEIIWGNDDSTKTNILELHPAEPHQFEQWLSVLQNLAPQTLYWNSIMDASTNTEESWIFDMESLRRSSVPKAWSLIGRKGAHSECSSMVLKNHFDTISLLSPELLPALFSQSPTSPLAESTLHLDSDTDLEDKASTVDSGLFIQDDLILPDLTGKIEKCGNYPAAHGGYSDVWKGNMNQNSSNSVVGVKVFRKLSSDPDSEQKVVKKLYKELAIWWKLDHPHIVPLLGTAADFGPYVSLVCPWFENGSVAKYMEGNGDILSVSDRLKLLCEIADGLAYLHAHSIIHGDLSGSNILVDKNGNAYLGDFGLSNVVEELNSGNSYMSTSIAGSVRWTDAYLFCLSEDESPRVITTKAIYIHLEV
ncbi:hypothetical protein BDQ17DRAFT_1536866 [Cyathus striatus]|nr:hypothetical protein BDQ17DRAFT_1536866 [Cyathus striatus]